ncbi:MAG: hypothetical protein HWD61_00635 [Parachlamydiaceae bacterium]|nr:MAG: hypothetical protein HWD61_00635 [Parachlamydiaceae bacterium]
MTTVGIQALPAVKFPNFYANQETEKEPAPDSNNTSPEEGNSNEDNHSKFNELFKKVFKILKSFGVLRIIQNMKLPGKTP